MLHFMADNVTGSGALDQIGQLLGTAAMLFVLFMVVAVISEQILEQFRGTLERFGITWLKSGISMKDAKAMIESLSTGPSPVLTAQQKVAATDALKRAEATQALFLKTAEDIAKLKTDLAATVEAPAGDTMTKALDDVAAAIKQGFDKKESARLYVLRWLTIVLCVAICVLSDINAFAAISNGLPGTTAANLLTGGVLSGMTIFGISIGHVATGFAASAGSQYWHDVLDHVRAAKSAVESARAVGMT